MTRLVGRGGELGPTFRSRNDDSPSGLTELTVDDFGRETTSCYRSGNTTHVMAIVPTQFPLQLGSGPLMHGLTFGKITCHGGH